jgi:simple sugar transport system ATP-binding protein
MMVGREVIRPKLTPVATGDAVLNVQALRLKGEGTRPLLDDVDLDIRAHEIVGIAGVAGNGQRELADILSGLRRDYQGSIMLLGEEVRGCRPRQLVERGVGRIPEDRQKISAAKI